MFCVADPNFEKNGKFEQIWVEYDEEHVEMIMNAAECFWRHNIFPQLLNSAKYM